MKKIFYFYLVPFGLMQIIVILDGGDFFWFTMESFRIVVFGWLMYVAGWALFSAQLEELGERGYRREFD